MYMPVLRRRVVPLLPATLLRASRTLAMATAVPPDEVEGVKEAEEITVPVKRRRGRLRKPDSEKRGKSRDEEGSEEEGPPPAKRGHGRSRKPDTAKASGQSTGKKGTKKDAADKPRTDWSSIEWSQLKPTEDSRPCNMKFSTWNVNGIRAWLKNGGFEYISHEDPDIFCLQEIKCADSALPKSELEVSGYHIYWNPADNPGYSGTGLYSKVKPLNVTFGMGIEKHDREGRLMTCEYEKFYFVTAYVPNAGEGLKRLPYRQEWDVDFRKYLKELDTKKPLILCGDLNVAHEEIDLKNPKSNKNTAGFTQQERDGFSSLLEEGFFDTFRQLYPDKQAFTYWSYRFNARAKNIGWRLDYFVISERLHGDVCDCVIRSTVLGSDHCPLVLTMAL